MTDRPNSSFQWESDDDGNVYALTPEGRKPIGTMVTALHAQDAAQGHNERLAAVAAGVRRVNLSGSTGVQFGHGNVQNNAW